MGLGERFHHSPALIQKLEFLADTQADIPN